MNKKGKNIGSFILALIIVLFGWWLYKTHLQDAWLANTNLNKITLNGIGLDDNLKNTKHFIKSKDDNQYVYDYKNKNTFTVTTTAKNKVICIEQISKNKSLNGASTKGLKFGESKKSVEQAFSKNYYISNSERYDKVMIYKDTKNHTKLIFGLDEHDKIDVIVLVDYHKLDYAL